MAKAKEDNAPETPESGNELQRKAYGKAREQRYYNHLTGKTHRIKVRNRIDLMERAKQKHAWPPPDDPA